MIEDLMKLKKQIDIIIETYHNLHPDEDDIRVKKINEDYTKEIALKRVRENHYEDKFSKSKGEETSESSEGQAKKSVRVS